ncbi:MAG: cbb3-type cytochrome c oxidase subunit I, partial [Chloroflexota bacterium]|nr:cbb3-type cytochrome c oxidase subunit I [Chloroflexota bacterium]
SHGTTMMFLFAIPVMEAVGIYLVPLMIGARDMAFPRLNAFGYWVFLIAGLTVWVALLTGNGPDAAWFNYVPLASEEYSPGIGIDVWTTAITFMEIATLVAAVDMVVTILRMRAPGMSLNRMPLFVWAMLVTSMMIIFAMPTVMLASVFLALDRLVGTHFYNPAEGGDPLLWQHLFWVFGHPEVYIILVPALGMISTIVATFARRSNAAYLLVALSLVAIGFLSFGLWVHHMFTTGLPWLSLSLFTAASMTIAIPSGIQVFSWIGTMWGTRPSFNTPMLYIFGFFFIFVLGGITGVMVAAIPFDEQVHDTFFVVAHFHYVLIGGGVFPLLGALHYWYPKFFGRMMHEGLGKVSFWLALVGFNVAFFPMHLLGLDGMPRQIYTYHNDVGWDTENLIATIGAYTFGFSLLLIFINVVWSRWRGDQAPDNPWGAGTLEWSVPSPPPPYNFVSIPVVPRQFPLWPNDEVGPALEGAQPDTIPDELFDPQLERREVVSTRMLDAKLERKYVLANPSIFPLLLALSVGLLFIGAIFSLWFVPIGAVLSLICALGWLLPRKGDWE